jgi:hypothetical protein
MHHSRKDSRIHTITDQFNRQNDKSNMIIAMRLHVGRNKNPKEDTELPDDAKALIVQDTRDTLLDDAEEEE